jgi:hypothetical protein
MIIHIPNGRSATTITLKDVLYAPEIAVTLVSIAKADGTGHSAVFQGGACTICDQRKKTVGRIPLRNGLYCVERGKSIAGNAFVTKDSLTVMELH